jgi:hypothetical protein
MMKFQISKWHAFRTEAQILGNILATFKDSNGTINFDKEEIKCFLDDINVVLKRANKYLNKCGLTQKPGLWKYNPEDPTTQASSVAFQYKHKMSKQQIKAYGKDFMKEPLPVAKEEKS